MTNPPHANPSLLIVDDELQIRRLLRVTLESGGYQVREAETGTLGLQEIAHQAPDGVILDLGLPDLDGTEVIRRLREWSKVPVLVLSVREGEDDKIGALDAGADDYLTKPFGGRELLARVRAILRRTPARRTTRAARSASMSPMRTTEGSLAAGVRRRMARTRASSSRPPKGLVR